MALNCMLLGHRLRATRRPGHFGVECTRCGKDATAPLPKGPLVLAHWRPHTERATIGTVALIALEADASPFLLGDLYEATDDGWRSEETGELLHVDVYHWLPERELLVGLRAPT